SGLAILHEPVVVPLPGGHIQIRATRPDDLCEEIFPFVSQFNHVRFDAVGIMTLDEVAVAKVQDRVRWFAGLAQLVLCASIREAQYRMDYHSCDWMGSGTIGSVDIGVKYRIGQITESNASEVARTFEALGKVFPSTVITPVQSKVDHLALAFHRF